MIQIKSKGPEGLCRNCGYGSYVRNARNETFVQCRYFDRTINAQVTECSEFVVKMTMTRSEMEHMAWIIDPRPGIGFIKPGTNRHKELADDGGPF